MKHCVYLDDERATPADTDDTTWHRVYTAKQCINYLKKVNEEPSETVVVDLLSLDHDLGEPEHVVGTGYGVVCWLEEAYHTDPTFRMPLKIVVHSANPVGRKRMQIVIDRLSVLSGKA